jgi:RNA polymerase sigma factor (sigma-70 family)
MRAPTERPFISLCGGADISQLRSELVSCHIVTPGRTQHGAFHTTRWSLVLASRRDQPEHQHALEELCTLYWPAVFSFYRRSGRAHDDAKELTQGLFLHLLERDDFAEAKEERGRFRAWLRSCASHFAANRHRDASAQRRGGGTREWSMDFERADDDRTWRVEPVDHETPERAFDRSFARAVLDTALTRLGQESAARGRGDWFATLRCYLEADGGPGFAASAKALGASEGAVKVAVHRLRTRFRELLVAEVRQTLSDPLDASDEIGRLLAALSTESRESP